MRLTPWGIRFGSWWAVQWRFDGCLSLGIHVEFRVNIKGDGGTFGPYVDLHFLNVILSLGNNPAYSTDLERVISVSRGGLPE